MDGGPRSGTPHEGEPVEAALARLSDLDDRPVAEHAEVFESLHHTLQQALDATVAAPDDPTPPSDAGGGRP